MYLSMGIGSAKVDTLSGVSIVSGIGLGLSLFVCTPFILSKLVDLESRIKTNKQTTYGNLSRYILNAKYFFSSVLRKLSLVNPEDGGVISEIIVYPIKSVGTGLTCEQWEVDTHGLKFDREYMLGVWDEKKAAYTPVTLREYARLAAIKIEFTKTSKDGEPLDGVFRFTYPLKDEDVSCGFVGKTFELPAIVTEEYAIAHSPEEGLQPVDVFGVTLTSHNITKALPDDFNGEIGLSQDTILMYSSTGKLVRTGSPPLREMKDLGSGFRKSLFHDYYPVLIFSQEDLNDLAERAKEYNIDVEVTAKAFRPNLVLAGCSSPHDTDSWLQFRVVSSTGDKHTWTVASKCARCPLPNVNLKTAEMNKKYPITNAINKYRRIDPGHKFAVFFGIYSIQHDSGYTIAVGDRIEVLRRKFTAFVDPE